VSQAGLGLRQEHNTPLNAEIEEFITAKISGIALKQRSWIKVSATSEQFTTANIRA